VVERHERVQFDQDRVVWVASGMVDCLREEQFLTTSILQKKVAQFSADFIVQITAELVVQFEWNIKLRSLWVSLVRNIH